MVGGRQESIPRALWRRDGFQTKMSVSNTGCFARRRQHRAVQFSRFGTEQQFVAPGPWVIPVQTTRCPSRRARAPSSQLRSTAFGGIAEASVVSPADLLHVCGASFLDAHS